MKTTTIGSLLFASLVAAVPMEKRDQVVVTATVIDTITDVVATTTVFADPDPTGGASQNFFPEAAVNNNNPPAATNNPPAAINNPPASQAAPSVPAQSAPSSAFNPPAQPTTAAAAPPAATQAPPQAAPPASSPASSPAPAPAPSAATGSTGASALSGQSESGDLTTFDAEGTPLACGQSHTNSDPIVAISHTTYDQFTPGGSGGNPNNNPLCGKSVTLTAFGQTVQATIADRCTGCQPGDLDLPTNFFESITGQTTGRFSVTWKYD